MTYSVNEVHSTLYCSAARGPSSSFFLCLCSRFWPVWLIRYNPMLYIITANQKVNIILTFVWCQRWFINLNFKPGTPNAYNLLSDLLSVGIILYYTEMYVKGSFYVRFKTRDTECSRAIFETSGLAVPWRAMIAKLQNYVSQRIRVKGIQRIQFGIGLE